MAKRSGPFKYYKGAYFIVFYDHDDDTILYLFDNVRQILEFQGKEINRQNINLLNVELYRALRSRTHNIKFLTGKKMKVYVIDVNKEDL